MAGDNEGKAKVGKVNVVQHMELAAKYNIMAVPTIIVFRDGEVVAQTKGFKEKEELQSMLDTV